MTGNPLHLRGQQESGQGPTHETGGLDSPLPPQPAGVHVVATAGHVDHGKSTLVRALTGTQPDRWAEEHRRGLTIDLGFAWTDLPSGRTVAFVDVPGHERFMTNMLAGSGPVTVALFVVAADEGWMPQSSEHLAALHALGVRHGLLVITRCDLSDPNPAREQALRELAPTTLGRPETLLVSGVTGEGLGELRAALDRLTARLPHPDTAAPVRLWADRSFTIRGAGTIVTGTLGAGTVRKGDELVLAPGGQRVRVRGLESMHQRARKVAATARVAVNLRGVEAGAARRGAALLTPGAWLTTSTVDVWLQAGHAAGFPAQLIAHIGSAATPARLRPLGSDTARLWLRTELPLHIGDRLLLRDPGRRRVLSGALALDVLPPAMPRRGAARRASALATMDGTADGAAELARRGIIRRAELTAMGCAVPPAQETGEWLIDPGHLERLREQLVAEVRRYATEHPLDSGLPKEAARRLLALPDLRLVDVLATGGGEHGVHDRDGRLVTGDGTPGLPDELQRALDHLGSDFATNPFVAPDAARLAGLGLTKGGLAAAVRAGALVRIGDGIYLPPTALEEAGRLLAGLPQPFTAAQAKTALGTTRRVAIPLLETLDARGVTVRLADSRRQVRVGQHCDR